MQDEKKQVMTGIVEKAQKELEKELGPTKAKQVLKAASGDKLKNYKGDGALVVVYGNYCPHCHALHNDLVELGKSLKNSKKEILMVDVQDSSAAAALPTISGVPSFFILDKGSSKLTEWNGHPREKDRLLTALSSSSSSTSGSAFSTLSASGSTLSSFSSSKQQRDMQHDDILHRLGFR